MLMLLLLLWAVAAGTDLCGWLGLCGAGKASGWSHNVCMCGGRVVINKCAVQV